MTKVETMGEAVARSRAWGTGRRDEALSRLEKCVHVHALERILADLAPGGPEYTERMCYHHDRDTLIADLAALKTFEEMCAYDEDEEIPVKPGEVDELIVRARELAGW